MSNGECRNPECRNRYTPGVIASGKGNEKTMIVGATMRWGWVNCRACNPKDKDPPYQNILRSAAEIAERARLADSKAPYVHQAVAQRGNLEVIKAATPAQSPAPQNAIDNSLVTKLMAQVEKLTDQITQLLEENRQLRRFSETTKAIQLPNENSPVVKKPRKKKGGNDDTNGAKGRRTLS
jgi:hypothetical protein